MCLVFAVLYQANASDVLARFVHLAGRVIWQLKEELVEAACSFVVCSVCDTQGYLLAAVSGVLK